MGKLKTKKSAVKRFWVSGKGKIMRRRAGNSHLFRKESPPRKRRLEIPAPLTPQDAKRIKRLLGV